MELNKNIFFTLESLRKKIGAHKAEIKNLREKRQTFNKSPFEIKLLEKGDIILSDVELDENVSYPAGLAAIGNTQVTLHILQAIIKKESFLNETEQIPFSSKPKVHVSDCKTLNEMKERGRYNRYIATQRQTNGYTLQPTDLITKDLLVKSIGVDEQTLGMKTALSFFNQKQDYGKMKLELQICKNCLTFLNYQDYDNVSQSEKKLIYNNFDLNEFLENFQYIFRCLPLYKEKDYPEAEYTNDWARISNEIRRKANWICSCCKVNLKYNKGFLHVHHKDGIRGNNKPSNLEVLCMLCHREKPFHQNMYVKDDERKKVFRLRKDQDLNTKCKKCSS